MKNNISRTYFTMQDCGIDLNSLISEDANEQKLVEILNLKFATSWIVYEDIAFDYGIPPEVNPSEEKINEWKNKFKLTLLESKDRYLKLLELYKANENNLLNKLENESTYYLNDTPQNAGDQSTFDYTSQISKTKISNDYADMMTKLDNIQKHYRNVMMEWIEYFKPLFGESLLLGRD